MPSQSANSTAIIIKKSGAEGPWRSALTALNDDDCYLLVMVEQAGISIPSRL